jgi:hypothetical protein
MLARTTKLVAMLYRISKFLELALLTFGASLQDYNGTSWVLVMAINSLKV